TDADVEPAGRRVYGEVDGCGKVRSAVTGVLQMDRQRGEVGVIALEYDLMDRCHAGWDLDRVDRRAQPFDDGGADLFLGDPERLCDAATRAHDIADEFMSVRPDILEIDGLGAAIEQLRHLAQFDAPIVNFHVTIGHELLEEAAKPEPVEIGNRL